MPSARPSPLCETPPADDADFMLFLMRRYDKGFRFWADVGNVGNRMTLDLLLHPQALPGFNDSGAHITNMAFFDGNLMALKLAQERDEMAVAKVVRRLTAEPAAFFGLDVGTLEIGAQADLVVIDPRRWRPGIAMTRATISTATSSSITRW
jgi:N-acyl-D-aspartate/D-glutamate deacylase